MKKTIFEVDVKGLRELQAGKPKWFIVRELTQNALDEEITVCTISMKYEKNKAYIQVIDDSPTGFRNLKDAYTLFGDTYKRMDANKRGRFNFGEKQVLCLCDAATIITTTGGVRFDMIGGKRMHLRTKSETGSSVSVEVKMKRDEFDECVEFAKSILPDENVKLSILCEDGETAIPFVPPHKIFTTKLTTEVKIDDAMRRVQRQTEVHLHKAVNGTAYIYEMGIPICQIDCDYSIDVRQKVPLSNDRDNVEAKYLKTLYAEVLNHTYSELQKEQSSDLWVRTAATSVRVAREAVDDIITKRFGENALIANQLDKRSMDEAKSRGFTTINGSEMSKEEWGIVKKFGLLESTSSKFKCDFTTGKIVLPDKKQYAIGELCKRIATCFLKMDLTVTFLESPEANTVADFNESHLRFNLSNINKSWWEPSSGGHVKAEIVDLIIHELGHSKGWHWEQSYHECITFLGSQLTVKALSEPDFFKI